MAPDGGVVDVAAEQTIDGRGGQEENIFTAIVSSGQAGFAGIADDVGFDSNAVAWLEGLHVGSYSNNLAGGFVTEDMVATHDHGADAAVVPEVNVRSIQVQLLVSVVRLYSSG